MQDPQAKNKFKFKTAHLLKLAHGRATEMYVARDKLQGKLEKFKKFRAYLKDSSKFNFQLPEPRAWPDGKSDGSDADRANTRSSGSKVGGAGAGRHDKVPAIMQLVFDRSNASKAQLRSRLKILETTRHCLSCERIVQKFRNGQWELVETEEHEMRNGTHVGRVAFPVCTRKPLGVDEVRKQRIRRSKKVAKEKDKIKKTLQKMD